MLIKLIKNEAHAIHEAVHIGWFSFVICCPAMRSEGGLESLEILHPFDCEVMRLNVSLIEDEDERQLCLVKNTEELGLAPPRSYC